MQTPLNLVVTAGPTIEPLDQVRRLTNFSTARLGSELAAFLSHQGHQVILLRGQASTWPVPKEEIVLRDFTTTVHLAERLQDCISASVDAVFHAAAVSDFQFGKIWEPSETGDLKELQSGKVSSRSGRLLAELVPTPKIIAKLRFWFPKAKLVGWKYEVDGSRSIALGKGREQILENRTDACVVNGPAYGEGFGLVLVNGESQHLTRAELFPALLRLLEPRVDQAPPIVYLPGQT